MIGGPEVDVDGTTRDGRTVRDPARGRVAARELETVSSATQRWRCAWAPTSAPARTCSSARASSMRPLARALARQSYAAGARYVDVHYGDQYVRKAMIELGPDRRSTTRPPGRSSASGDRRERDDRHHRRPGAAPVRRSRRRPSRPRPSHRRDQGAPAADHREHDELDGVAYPNEGWARQVFGEPDVERLWQAVAPARASTRTTRSRPGGAHGPPRRPGARAERAGARPAHLPRPGHRARDRPARAVSLRLGALPHGRRPRVRGEHADRGGVRHARRAARRGRRRLDQAARGRRRRGRRAPGHLRGRADRRRPGGARRRCDPRPAPGRRERLASRRGRTGRRDFAGRQDRPHLLRHAVRRERDVPHRLRRGGGRRATRVSSPTTGSTSRPCTRTS